MIKNTTIKQSTFSQITTYILDKILKVYAFFSFVLIALAIVVFFSQFFI